MLKEQTTTEAGNKISLFEYKGNQKENKILFLGVTHGDEPQGKYLIEKYMELLTNNSIQNDNTMLFVPCVNPDGLKLKQRTNGNGVDINRNFPTSNWVLSDKNEFYGGEKPNSEIETSFLVNVIEKYRPDIIISFHAPFKLINYDGAAKDIAIKISAITGLPIQENIGYPTPGSFGTYCGIEKNIPTITVELDETVDNEKQWETCFGIFKMFEK